MVNKYKIHILTTLNNNKRAAVIHTDFKENSLAKQRLNYENDFICQSIDNLKQTIESVLENHIFKSVNKIQNEKFHWLLNYMNQLLVTYKYQYCNNEQFTSNRMSGFHLTTNKIQQQMASSLYV
jgi:hypothetical protein